MSEKDVVENVESPGEIGIPIANNSTPGIASFDSNDFTVGTDGKVSSIVERGIPQYLGKITGTGTGTTDLNWEVDMNTVKQNKPIKLGEYIMLTERFNQFVPGDIFRITNVQIEGSKYTVKTNNVRALSLASIVGPQGEQGNEGPQGVPYLAYTGSIESTTDPAPGSTMQLEDGHFNRTPIINAGEYQDVVTLDWYNKTTHRAFMVTGLIQGKNNATNQWAALITAVTDITGAVGPQGKEGAGIADIVDIDYPHVEFTSVQYDTTDGIKMRGIAKYLRDDGETYQIPTGIDVPLVAGDGLSIDKKESEEKVEINSLNSNLENGTGTGSLVQKRLKSDGVTWTTTKAYQGASTALGGGTQVGRTEEEFNAYFWDSATNKPLHGGSKNSSGEILDNHGLTYKESYSFSVAEGELTKALGRGSHSDGYSTKTEGEYSHTEGWKTVARGLASHAEGDQTTASGDFSHAAGFGTSAKGVASYAEGMSTEAIGDKSHVEGFATRASEEFQHVEGVYNADNPNALHIVGNGTSENARKNAFVVLKDGRAKVQSAPKDNDDVVRKGDLAGIGGKIYRHEISVTLDANSDLYFYFTDKVKKYSKFTDIPIKKGVCYYNSNNYATCPAVFKIDVPGNMLCIYLISMDITNPSAGVQYNDIYKDFNLITYTDTAIQL